MDEVLVSNKVNRLIGSELTSVYYNNPTGLPSPFFIIDNGKIRIDVIVKVNNYDYVLNLLQQTAPIDYGLTNIVTNGENGLGKKELIITGDYPIANLLKLNELGDYINYCRPFYEAFSNNSGLVSSAGDTTMRSHLVRSGYKINGSGIKVGVISNSFATITNGTTATQPLTRYQARRKLLLQIPRRRISAMVTCQLLLFFKTIPSEVRMKEERCCK